MKTINATKILINATYSILLNTMRHYSSFRTFVHRMNFTAIDFETAQALYPCEIGIVKVENGIIKEKYSSLIKPACFPYMNPMHKSVHGISSNDVAEAKTFEELWSDIRYWLEDEIVVAHNALFDMEVLRSSLSYYDLAIPWIDYFCSISLAKKVWKKLPSYSLGALCKLHDIRFNHHQAEDDAMACALITLKAFESANCTDLESGFQTLNMKTKRLKAK